MTDHPKALPPLECWLKIVGGQKRLLTDILNLLDDEINACCDPTVKKEFKRLRVAINATFRSNTYLNKLNRLRDEAKIEEWKGRQRP